MALIDRDALIEHITDADSIISEYLPSGDHAQIEETLCDAIDAIINSKPVVHGEWIVIDSEKPDNPSCGGYIKVKCSCCGYEIGVESGQFGWYYGGEFPINYCPHCGADMRGGNNGTAIDSKPVDAVEVVRCKDCKHSNYDDEFLKRWCCYYLSPSEKSDNDFCSCGERK